MVNVIKFYANVRYFFRIAKEWKKYCVFQIKSLSLARFNLIVIMKTKKDIMSMIGTAVHSTEPTAETILFGSQARGDARSDSDWDVVIIVDSPNVSKSQFKKLSYDIWVMGLNTGIEINPLIYTRQQWDNARPTLFKYNVMNDGIRI